MVPGKGRSGKRRVPPGWSTEGLRGSEGLRIRPCCHAAWLSLSRCLPLNELKLHGRSPRSTQSNKSNEDCCSASCVPTAPFPELCLFFLLGNLGLNTVTDTQDSGHDDLFQTFSRFSQLR